MAGIQGIDPSNKIKEVAVDESGRIKIGGGTAFGDDITATFRTPTMAGKWSQGLLLGAVEIHNPSTFGFWEVLEDENGSSYHDGACAVGIAEGAPDDAVYMLNTIKPNRYVAGHLSYYGYTAGFNTESANGDCTILIGAFIRGAASQSEDHLIKDGMVWGIKRVSGINIPIFRVYKNFTITYETNLTINFDLSKLHIFEQKLGYYGIHPAIITALEVNEENRTTNRKIFAFKDFEQESTSVSDPDMYMGVYIENQGNTGKIQLINGSIEFGNYITNPSQFDPSARFLSTSVDVATTVAKVDDTNADAANGLLAAYTVSDTVSMVSKMNATIEYSDFRNTIGNQLLDFESVGTPSNANRVVRVNIHILPASAVVATFTQLVPGVNVLERALAAQVVSWDKSQVKYTISSRISSLGVVKPLSDKEVVLRSGEVAIITLQAASTQTTVTDISVTFNTKELF